MRIAAAVAALALTSCQALADWNYVQWGMKPSQAIAASGGEAVAAKADGKNIACAFTDQTVVARVPTKKIGSSNYEVTICAAGGGISSVVLRPQPADGSFNTLRTTLLGRYGKPIEEGRGDISVTTWRDEKGKNLVRLVRVIDTASIEYRSLGSGSGL
jgi:hypothetical protein